MKHNRHQWSLTILLIPYKFMYVYLYFSIMFNYVYMKLFVYVYMHIFIPGLTKNYTIFIGEKKTNHTLFTQFHKYKKLHERSVVSDFSYMNMTSFFP